MVDLKICWTGQHDDLGLEILKLFQLSLDYKIKLQKTNKNLLSIFSGIMENLEPIIQDFDPHWVVVHGDTLTCFAASLVSFYTGHRIAHVEAGLRTSSLNDPWPEEAHRRLVSVIADRFYAPTKNSLDNLLREGMPQSQIVMTGNTIIDTVKFVEKKFLNFTKQSRLEEKYNFLDKKKKLIFLTFHRRNLHGEKAVEVCEAIKKLDGRTDVEFIFPVHPHPSIRTPVLKYLSRSKNVFLFEPFEYTTLLFFLKKANLIMTDSGGLQEEGVYFKKPIFVIRESTERPEVIECGLGKIVSTTKEKIIEAVSAFLESSEQPDMSLPHVFGDGNASKKIADDLLNFSRFCENKLYHDI